MQAWKQLFSIAVILTVMLETGIVRSDVIESYAKWGRLRYTFVHGGVEAKKTFADAEAYCRGIAQPNSTETSHLVSFHWQSDVDHIMQWIQRLAVKKFWIGAELVKKPAFFIFRNRFALKWTDGTVGNFNNFRSPKPSQMKAMSRMQPGTSACTAVEDLAGNFGAHNCTNNYYFLCLTRAVVGADLSDLQFHILNSKTITGAGQAGGSELSANSVMKQVDRAISNTMKGVDATATATGTGTGMGTGTGTGTTTMTMTTTGVADTPTPAVSVSHGSSGRAL